jgi:hypothetical protein
MKPSVRYATVDSRQHDVQSRRWVVAARRTGGILCVFAAVTLASTDTLAHRLPVPSQLVGFAAPAARSVAATGNASESILVLTAIDPGTPGYDQLGAGYDVFTAYADAEFVRNPVLDLEALNSAGKLGQFPVDKFTVNQLQGTTIDEYVTSLGVSAGLSGSYGFFSGSINSTLSQMGSVTTQWSFATIQVKHRVYGLSVVRMEATDLQRYLLPDFADDINSDLDPAVLFQLYGTHVIGKLVVGGRLDYNLSAWISSEQQKRNIGVYAEAKFDSGFASLDLNTTFDYSTYRSQYVSQEQVSMASVGGQGSSARIWTDGDYTAWVDTVWEHPVFCDFGADPWLIPIWDLAAGGCGAGSRCEAIHDAYRRYAASKHINLPGVSRDVLVDLAVTPDIPSTQTGFAPLADVNGAAGLAYVNKGVSSARTPQRQSDGIMEARKLWISYKAVAEEQATSAPINGIHFYTGAGDLEAELAYGPHTLMHMNVDGVDQSADLSYDTCEGPTWWHTTPCPTSLCAYDCDNVRCDKLSTNLRQLHFTTVSALLPQAPIQSLVLADPAAIVTSNDFATRKAALRWGPQDLNHDGKVDDADVQLVLERVVWVSGAGGLPMNLNAGAQNYYVYDYECPWGCCWVKTSITAAPAQYLGYVPYADAIITCAGDCNGDQSVTIDELLTLVNIALEAMDIDACSAADLDQNRAITIDEILAAVGRALTSCTEG